MQRRAVHSHIITSYFAVRLMASGRRGLIVEVTDGATMDYRGRAVVALAADPTVASKAGKVYGSWDLSKEYGFTDVDGTQPDWGAHWDEFTALAQGGKGSG